MDGSGGSPFALHFDDGGGGAPQVGLIHGGPGIGPLPHGRRGGDGVNGNDFTEAIGNTGDRFVAVEGGVGGGGGGGSSHNQKLPSTAERIMD